MRHQISTVMILRSLTAFTSSLYIIKVEIKKLRFEIEQYSRNLSQKLIKAIVQFQISYNEHDGISTTNIFSSIYGAILAS